MKNKLIYAFIFAKKNSFRLKNKNLKKIGNLSLVERSIKIAKQIKKIDKIFVSTDSKKIIKIAKKEKVNFIPRPKKLTSKNSLEIYSWKHAIIFLKKNQINFDIFLSLPPTSPLRDVNDVKRLIDNFLVNKSDLTLAISKTNRSPFFNMVKKTKNGRISLLMKKNMISKDNIFDITTIGYVAKASYILKAKKLFQGNIKSIEIPRERAIDIDDAYDFKIASYLHGNKK